MFSERNSRTIDAHAERTKLFRLVLSCLAISVSAIFSAWERRTARGVGRFIIPIGALVVAPLNAKHRFRGEHTETGFLER
jgi:hypothetical protein